VNRKMITAAMASVFLFSILMATFSTALAAEQKIAVLNLRKVFTSSEAGQTAQKEMEKKVEALQQKFKQDEDALISLQNEIEKKSSVWSEEKKQEKAIEFKRMQRDMRAKQEDASLELKKMEEQQLGPIRKELEQVIENVAKEKGYAIIVPSEVVMFAVDSVDITEEVTKALNARSK
jgi:outer membrane protein